MLRTTSEHGKLLTVRDGWLVCPHCRNKRLLRVPITAAARGVPVWCAKCKHEIIVDIEQGRSFESRSQ